MAIRASATPKATYKATLFLCCYHPEWLVKIARKGSNWRTAGRILENLAVSVVRIPTIDKALDDPGLRAVAGTRVLCGALQGRFGSADRVPICRVRYLVEDGEVRAVPL